MVRTEKEVERIRRAYIAQLKRMYSTVMRKLLKDNSISRLADMMS